MEYQRDRYTVLISIVIKKKTKIFNSTAEISQTIGDLNMETESEIDV